MRRTNWITATLLFSMATTAAAADRPLAGNAALQYWLAFAMLPDLNEAERTSLSIAEEFVSRPLDATARNLATRSGMALGFLARGAELAACDWGIDIRRDGPGTLLPHLSKARRLADLAALRARARLADGQVDAALDDLLASLALARHLGSDGLLISLLVQGALEEQALEVLQPQVETFDAATRKRVAERIDALPAGGSLQVAIGSERQGMVDWALATLQRNPQSMWEALGNAGGEVQATVRQQTGGTEEGLTRLVRAAGDYYDELARLDKLPDAEAAAAWEALLARAEKENALAALLLPAYDKAREREQQRQARIASLRAVLRGETPAAVPEE